jgi:hypothetical protein
MVGFWLTRSSSPLVESMFSIAIQRERIVSPMTKKLTITGIQHELEGSAFFTVLPW